MTRYQNGWTDTGARLRGTEEEKCPNCGSPGFRQTLSREYCGACGLKCDYWGKGPNSVYLRLMEKNAVRAREAKEQRFRQQYAREWGEEYTD